MILILSEIDWNYLWQRHQIWATLYAKSGHKTVYVNRTGMRLPRISDTGYILNRLFKKNEKNTENLPDNLQITSPIFLPSQKKILSLLNQKIFIPQFSKTHDLENDCRWLHVYQPTELTKNFIEKHKNAKVIYDCVQNFEKHPSATKETKAIESWLIERSDIMITDSDFLYDKHSRIKKDLLHVPPGVDFEHFSSAFSKKLAANSKNNLKKFLYFGNIRSDLNFSLINELADHNYEVTLLGKLHKECASLISPKVTIMPQQPYSNLPQIIKDYDALLLPYALNDFTKGIIPAKTYECLATGKPILATRLPSFDKLSPYLYFYEGDNILKIVDTMKNETTQQVEDRIDFSVKASWEGRFESFFSKM